MGLGGCVDKMDRRKLEVVLGVLFIIWIWSLEEGYFTVRDEGPLGSQLFALASTIGLSYRNGLIPCYDPVNIPDDLFDIDVPRCPLSMRTNPREINFRNVYRKTNYVFHGSVRSYKYFGVNSVLKRVKLKRHVVENADKYLKGLFEDDTSLDHLVYIHISRVDKKDREIRKFPPMSYFVRSMEYFRVLYGEKVRFLVNYDGDDGGWVRTSGLFKSKDTVIVDGFDFVVLSRCLGGTISTSVNALSWWGNFFGPRKNFLYWRFESGVELNDYYPPWSIAIN